MAHPGPVRRRLDLLWPHATASGYLPPPLVASDSKTLKIALEEINRLLERQWQSAVQLAQAAGILLGATAATVAGVVSAFHAPPFGNATLTISSAATLAVSSSFSLGLATGNQNAGVGPNPEILGLQTSRPEDWLNYELIKKLSTRRDGRLFVYGRVASLIGVALLISAIAR